LRFVLTTTTTLPLVKNNKVTSRWQCLGSLTVFLGAESCNVTDFVPGLDEAVQVPDFVTQQFCSCTFFVADKCISTKTLANLFHSTIQFDVAKLRNGKEFKRNVKKLMPCSVLLTTTAVNNYLLDQVNHFDNHVTIYMGNNEPHEILPSRPVIWLQHKTEVNLGMKYRQMNFW
jgi:hypothetical protein